MDPVDQARRSAEDQLLIGDPAECEAALADTESKLHTAIARLRVIRQVTQLRDRAMAELGYLARSVNRQSDRRWQDSRAFERQVRVACCWKVKQTIRK